MMFYPALISMEYQRDKGVSNNPYHHFLRNDTILFPPMVYHLSSILNKLLKPIKLSVLF